MADEGVLKSEVRRILSEQEKRNICVLINTDCYSGKLVRASGEKLFLIDDINFIADNGCDSLENHITKKYDLSKENILDLSSKNSDVNRELKRYIKSNRILNSTLFGKISCQTIEDELAEVKGNLFILVNKIQVLIASKSLEDVCFLIYGRMSGNYLIERYLREALSYDADLADPAIYVCPEIVSDEDFDKKETLNNIQIVLLKNAEKTKINIAPSNDRDNGFFCPIYVKERGMIILENEHEVWNIELPFQISDYGAELIELKLWNDENNENVLLIKRLASSEIYDFKL